MKAKHHILFFISAALMSCQGGFYDYSRRSDLWRLPLIEPYELYLFAGAKRENPLNTWHLDFRTLYKPSFAAHTNVTNLNVSKGIIYGFGTMPPCKHFLIDTQTGREKEFDDLDEWRSELKHLGVDPEELYDAWELFIQFRDHGILKWRPAK